MFVICSRCVRWVFALFPWLWLGGVGASAVRAELQLYVGPEAAGDERGDSPDNAGFYDDKEFWRRAQAALAEEPVTVFFLEGQYTRRLRLSHCGHETHRLVLDAQRPQRAAFSGSGSLSLSSCRNMTVRNLRFTGNAPNRNIYKFTIGQDRGSRAAPSQDILVEKNLFDQAPTYYGALGVHHGSNRVTVFDNEFLRVGQDSHAHMIYTAHGVRFLKVIGNRFEDCTGDYVRFRDRCEFGEVRRNAFRSTRGGCNRPFVQIPVFNDVDPGDEEHGSNYLICDNEFVYDTADAADYRDVMGFWSSGFDPPGRDYLLTRRQAQTLQRGTPDEKRRLMLDNLGIDLTKVRVLRNEITGGNKTFRYGLNAAYGAKSKGFTGSIEILDAVNSVEIRPGDVHSNGALDAEDVRLFVKALEAEDELSFLLDPDVWFGDYVAADVNRDGRVDSDDIPGFLDLMADRVPESALEPVRRWQRRAHKTR